MPLLDADAKPYSELVANGRTYRVPRFQRDYSWEPDYWEDLWRDIEALLEDKGKLHYMGAIVVQSSDGRIFELIDGQQRFATLSLLALAVIERLKRLIESGVEAVENSERIEILRGAFLGDKDPASLTYRSKLRLNRNDDDFFQHRLLQFDFPPNPVRLPLSNKRMIDALNYFRSRLEQVQFSEDGPELARFLTDVVGRRLIFIVITVEDELNAYTLFETLNARGVGLSPSDLIKNYLYGQVAASEADLDRLDRKWRDLIGRTRPDRFPEFLRHYLNCHEKRVRRESLFRITRSRARGAREVFSFVSDLEIYAELFAALPDPNHEYWREDSQRRRAIQALSCFGVTQVYPVLFAAYRQFSAGDFSSTLRMAAVISFRYNVVSQLSTSELEAHYNDAAIDILLGAIRSPRALFEALAPLYVADEKFKSDFSYFSIPAVGRRKKLVRYIAFELESDLQGRRIDPDADNGTLEHILPENPDEEWLEGFQPDEVEQEVHRLGNITLLEPALNRECANRTFREKMEIYRKSTYQLTRDISMADEWTPQEISGRQRRLAERAAAIWRLDF